jgi:hypothetical protein
MSKKKGKIVQFRTMREVFRFSRHQAGATPRGILRLPHPIVTIKEEIARLHNLTMAGEIHLRERRFIGALLREKTEEVIGKGHLQSPSSLIVTPIGRNDQPHL